MKKYRGTITLDVEVDAHEGEEDATHRNLGAHALNAANMLRMDGIVVTGTTFDVGDAPEPRPDFRELFGELLSRMDQLAPSYDVAAAQGVRVPTLADLVGNSCDCDSCKRRRRGQS